MHVRVLNRHMHSIDVQYGACDGSEPSPATTNPGNSYETVFQMHVRVLHRHMYSIDVQYGACDGSKPSHALEILKIGIKLYFRCM
jgi:hypothetical protein